MAQELLGVSTNGGGLPGPREVGGGESKKSKKPSKLLGMYKNGAKMAGFLHVLP